MCGEGLASALQAPCLHDLRAGQRAYRDGIGARGRGVSKYQAVSLAVSPSPPPAARKLLMGSPAERPSPASPAQHGDSNQPRCSLLLPIDLSASKT